MTTKRLNIELPAEQYEFLRREAAAREKTVSGLIREFIETERKAPTREPRPEDADDPLLRRQGSFDGPSDLSERHDRYLYDSTNR